MSWWRIWKLIVWMNCFRGMSQPIPLCSLNEHVHKYFVCFLFAFVLLYYSKQYGIQRCVVGAPFYKRGLRLDLNVWSSESKYFVWERLWKLAVLKIGFVIIPAFNVGMYSYVDRRLGESLKEIGFVSCQCLVCCCPGVVSLPCFSKRMVVLRPELINLVIKTYCLWCQLSLPCHLRE